MSSPWTIKVAFSVTHLLLRQSQSWLVTRLTSFSSHICHLPMAFCKLQMCICRMFTVKIFVIIYPSRPGWIKPFYNYCFKKPHCLKPPHEYKQEFVMPVWICQQCSISALLGCSNFVVKPWENASDERHQNGGGCVVNRGLSSSFV